MSEANTAAFKFEVVKFADRFANRRDKSEYRIREMLV